LSSPQSLANFLEHDNITDIDLILKEIEQGNLDLLVNVMQAKIDALMQNITQDTLETSLNDFDIQDKSIQNNDLNEQEDNLEEFVEPRQEEDEQEDFEEFVPETETEIEAEAGAEKSNIPDDISQIPLTELPKARPVASIVEIEPVEQVSSDNKSSSTSDKEPDTLPDNLPDMLRYVLKLKERITAKSLSESFKIFGVDISQALARFIIEEGRYGGEAPNNNRITQMSMVEKLIDDIEKESDLKSFVKIYLTKVNDDLKSMIAGGGGG
jgi:hypothetical protein